MIKLTKTKTTAFQSNVIKNAPTPGGKNPGGLAIGMPIRPVVIAKYVSMVISNGPNTKGMNINGFNMIGAPNISGSLIPNSEGIIETLPIAFKFFALDRIINNTKPSVNPDPVTCNML